MYHDLQNQPNKNKILHFLHLEQFNNETFIIDMIWPKMERFEPQFTELSSQSFQISKKTYLNYTKRRAKRRNAVTQLPVIFTALELEPSSDFSSSFAGILQLSSLQTS